MLLILRSSSRSSLVIPLIEFSSACSAFGRSPGRGWRWPTGACDEDEDAPRDPAPPDEPPPLCASAAASATSIRSPIAITIVFMLLLRVSGIGETRHSPAGG